MADDGALRQAVRRIARVRLTGRGVALLCTGGVLVVVGIVLALPDVVGLGAAGALAVGAAWVAMGLQRLDSGRGALVVTRQIAPNPVVRGQSADAQLLVAARARSGAAYERLARLRLSEQAAHELAGPHGIRASVSAHPDRVAVRYSLVPVRRGRWALGPLLTTRTDVFGLVRTTQPLGEATSVAVWPRTTELSARTRVRGEVDRAATGARLASTDDSVLREYVAGDDPRRVHWARSARQGRLMVRADESSGVRPVTVLLDRALLPPPVEPRTGPWPTQRSVQAVDDGEWAVELAASIAVAFLEAGHPARLVPTSVVTHATTSRFVTGARAGRPTVLDATVDLHGHRNAAEAERALTATVRSLRLDRGTGEITVALLGPVAAAARHDLASLAAEGVCWALVVQPRAVGFGHDAAETVTALRTAGWRVATCPPGTPADRAWALLQERAE
ncbi:DUF58 domain-containing protein [Isoptericola variabilis]|uniref:DUF58 domain-containing protein n=1 Tax=Isoptericola variabilis (strain 225) TaxID=743718 RepID=F6FSI1_ISOV2|nr:DUF58 domain-containing protein [Isoptericola variabilis]AEG44048.1 protein of unknown function DUF58 [Isoptericola variabilis 225]